MSLVVVAALGRSQTVGVLLTGFLYAHYGAVPAFTLAAIILPVLGIVMRMRIKGNAFRAAEQDARLHR